MRVVVLEEALFNALGQTRVPRRETACRRVLQHLEISCPRRQGASPEPVDRASSNARSLETSSLGDRRLASVESPPRA